MNRRHHGVRGAGRGAPVPRSARNPLPTTPAGLDPAALGAAYAATRALLTAASPRDVVDVVFGLVDALGGVVIPARVATVDTLPLDLSLGVGEPMLAQAEPASIPRLRLEALLPSFLEDARGVAMALRQAGHLQDEVTADPLTGLLTRKVLDRRLHLLRCGDAIAVIEFDQFDRFTESAGRPAGDTLLASFGRLLRENLRADDLIGRHSRHDLLVGAPAVSPQRLGQRLDQLRRVWTAARPHPVTFSAWVAPVRTTAAHALGEIHDVLVAERPAEHDRTEVIQ